MQDVHVATVQYTEPMLRRAVRAFVWRRLLARGWLWSAAIGLLLASAVLGWAGGPGFGTGAAVAGLVFLLAVVAAIWRAHFLNTVGRFRALDPPSARVAFGERELTVTSNLGSSTIPWSRFEEVWERDDAWLLFLAPSQFMTLPVADLPETVRDHIRARVIPKRSDRPAPPDRRQPA